ncbi:acyl-CoA dehydrogenase family protein [Kitasatospora sp. NPDC054939]
MSTVHPSLRAARALDRELGDPRDDGRIFSHRRIADLDEHERFPLEIVRELDLLGLPDHYVPVAHGGSLARYDSAVQLMRTIARRDLTSAIAHGKTFLGAVSVWTGGTAEQAARLGADVRDGAVVSWGLTEREHGSDLMAGDVTAEPVGGGYRLTGEKWLINNANRGHLVCVLARTGGEGPRALSLFLVDKRPLAPGEFTLLPGTRLHGIRGADISGIAFHDAPLPAAARIGAEGEGLETVLKSLQLTRTLCSSLSLGAGDHALGMVLDYTHRRTMYDRPLFDLPQSRRTVAEAAADLLLAEAVSLLASRGIHALTGELAVASAATKYLVPTVVQGALTRLGGVMGARSLVVGDTYEHGRFQKVQRDHRIVGIFDGSTLVNLHALINQFPFLERAHRRGRVDAAGLAAAADLGAELPDFDRAQLSLLARAGCSPVQALPEAVRELVELAAKGELPASLARRAEALLAATEDVLARIARYRPTAVEVPREAFTLAEDYARCFAGAAAVHLWLRSSAAALADGGPTAQLWRDGLWLEAALARVAALIRPGALPAGDDEVFERLAPVVAAQHRAGLLVSLLPYSVDRSRAPEEAGR